MPRAAGDLKVGWRLCLEQQAIEKWGGGYAYSNMWLKSEVEVIPWAAGDWKVGWRLCLEQQVIEKWGGAGEGDSGLAAARKAEINEREYKSEWGKMERDERAKRRGHHPLFIDTFFNFFFY